MLSMMQGDNGEQRLPSNGAKRHCKLYTLNEQFYHIFVNDNIKHTGLTEFSKLFNKTIFKYQGFSMILIMTHCQGKWF